MSTTPAQTLSSPVTAGPEDRSTVRRRIQVSRFGWGVLAYTIVVILWGTVVRATGSGDGCGDHWPLCNGSLILSHPKLATIIEFIHRATSGITFFAVVALLYLTYRVTVKGHLARIAATAAFILTCNEAFLGAVLVLRKLTADNHSPERAFVLSLHLANTLLLLAAMALCAHFLSRKEAFARGDFEVQHFAPSLAGLGALLAVGVSGSLAALGDTLFPASSHHLQFFEDFARHADWLLHLRLLHPLTAAIAGGFILWLVSNALIGADRRRHRGLGFAVIVLLLAQYCLGISDILLLIPVWMQVSHLLVADLLWVTLVVLAARVSIVPRQGSTRVSPAPQT